MIRRHKQLKEIEDMIQTIRQKLAEEIHRGGVEPYSAHSFNELKKAGRELLHAECIIEDVREYGKMLSEEL